MKRIVLLFLLCIPFAMYSQVQKERRVYYLDCSYSMVTNKLWGKVRDNLKNAIDAVEDQTTELMVIPFAVDGKHHSCLTPFIEKATNDGKSKLKASVDNLPQPSKSSMTYHDDAINDFMNYRVASNKVTYLFLMTDGLDENKANQFDKIVRSQWSNKYGSKDVYGFYVMLQQAARNPKREKLINDAQHFWTVETANVNINLIRMQSNAYLNLKNDKYFEVPIYGNHQGKKFHARFSNPTFKPTQTSVVNGKLRVYVSSNSRNTSIENLSITMTGGGKFDFLVTENIRVKCEYKPERSLKVSVR